MTQPGRGVCPHLCRELVAASLALLVLAYAWTYADVSVPNERTRAYLSVAIVEDASFAIDGPMQRYGRVFDLAERDGHFYTDKAPGTSLLGAPVYALGRRAYPSVERDPAALVNLFRDFVALPLALLGFFAMRGVLRALGRAPWAVELGSFGLVLATPFFHYGTAVYGHVAVAAFWLLSVWAQLRAGVFDGETGIRPALVLAGGAAAGMLGLVEYQAIPMAALLGLPLLGLRGSARLRALLAFVLGALPFALLLLFYNAVAFGGPFELSYHHLSGSQLTALHGHGLAGATRPTAEAMLGLSFSSARGLVPTAPLAALGVLGLFFARESLGRRFTLVLALSFAYLFLIVSSSSVWNGSWSAGPRLLVPVMPALVIAAVSWAELRPGLVLRSTLGAAAVYGLLYQLALQLTFAETPPEFARPLAESVRPLLEAGLRAPNLGCRVWGDTSATLLPVFVLALVVVERLVRIDGTRRQRMAVAASSALLGAFAFTAALALPPANTEADRRAWQEVVAGWSRMETACRRP